MNQCHKQPLSAGICWISNASQGRCVLQRLQKMWKGRMQGCPYRYCHADVLSYITQELILGSSIFLPQWIFKATNNLPPTCLQGGVCADPQKSTALARAAALGCSRQRRGWHQPSRFWFLSLRLYPFAAGRGLQLRCGARFEFTSLAPSKELCASPLPRLLPEASECTGRTGVCWSLES